MPACPAQPTRRPGAPLIVERLPLHAHHGTTLRYRRGSRARERRHHGRAGALASASPPPTSWVVRPGPAGASPRPSSDATPGRRASSSVAAVVAGLASAGVDVHDAGVLPTPAIAFLTADMDADFGVMLSASHNAMPDNGIKFFAAGGHKLARRRRGRDRGQPRPASGSARSAPTIGRVAHHTAPARRATSPTCSRPCPTASTDSRSSSTARTARRQQCRPRCSALAGAEVVEIGTEPDGLNINDGYGSTAPRPPQGRRHRPRGRPRHRPRR